MMMEQGGGGRGRGGRPRGQGRRFGVQERRRNDEQHTGLEPRDDYALTPTRSASQSGERTPNNPRAGRADATERHNARSRFEPPPRRTRVRGRDSFVPPPMQEYHQAKEALDLVLEVFRPGPSDNWRGIETELDTQEQDKVYAVLKSAVAPADNVMHDRWNSDFSTNVQDNLELVCATIEKSGFLLVEDCEPARSKDTNPAQLGHSTSWLSGKVSKPRPFFPLYPTAHTVTGVWASKNEDEGPVHLEKNFQKRFMPLQDHKRNPRPEFRIDRIYTFGFDTKPTSHIGLQLATLDLALPMRKRRGQMDDDSVIVLKYMAKELYEKDLDDHRKCIGLKEADEKAIHQRIELTRKEKARKAEEKVDGAPSRAAQSNADGALSEEGIGREEDECGQTCPQSAHALRESVGGAEDADLKPGQATLTDKDAHPSRLARPTGSSENPLPLTPSSTSPGLSSLASSPSPTTPSSAQASFDWSKVPNGPSNNGLEDVRNRGTRQGRGTYTYANAQSAVMQNSRAPHQGVVGTTTAATQAVNPLTMQDGSGPDRASNGRPQEKRGHAEAFGLRSEASDGSRVKRTRWS